MVQVQAKKHFKALLTSDPEFRTKDFTLQYLAKQCTERRQVLQAKKVRTLHPFTQQNKK